MIHTRMVTRWRVCMDYRHLNKVTIKDRLAGKECYCFLDGYSDEVKTTFMCPYRTFAFCRMSSGLCNAPTTSQRCMTIIFWDMNDFPIFPKYFARCLKILENVLKRCEESRLVLNWDKCHFMVHEGILLGHKISGKRIEVTG